MKDLDLLRYSILDEDYDNQNRIYICHYDGINSNLSKVYNNGDTYERIYEMDEDNKIIKVIIKFYEKESNISYLCEKAINSNIINLSFGIIPKFLILILVSNISLKMTNIQQT